MGVQSSWHDDRSTDNSMAFYSLKCKNACGLCLARNIYFDEREKKQSLFIKLDYKSPVAVQASTK